MLWASARLAADDVLGICSCEMFVLFRGVPMMWPLVVVVTFLVGGGCASEVVEYYPEPDTGLDDVAASPDQGSETGVDGSAPPSWAGLACESPADCGDDPSRVCADRALLDSFGVGPEIDLPGGMCTRLLCGGDEDCGPDGMCFDASFLGAPVQICLAQCQTLVDCRWEEGWDCLPVSMVIEGGEGGVCLSDSIQVAIGCDDGSCEEGEGE